MNITKKPQLTTISIVVSKRLLITQCSDSMMWYANKVGKEVYFIREESDCYVSREDDGFVNIVKKCDAVILNVG